MAILYFRALHKYMPIRILVTGGTFDKEYNELTQQLVFNNTHIKEILEFGRFNQPVEVSVLMLIDSLKMTDDHRNQILEQCKNCPEDRIVITHGTDTMEQTAQFLGNAIKDKTIVLTGGMIPYKYSGSDGPFNLGCALAFAQALPRGVYVTMNGTYFAWDNVRKNLQTGYFENIK